MEALIISEKFVYYSYRIDQIIVIQFHKSGLLNEFKISETLVRAMLDVHRKGMESVFIIAKCCNNASN